MSEEECCKVNIFDSAADSVKRVIKDRRIVTASQQAERLSICVQCEHFSQGNAVCKKCWCFLKLKTQFANMCCPIDKWTEIEDVQT